MRRARQMAALLGLAASLTPFGSGAAVTLHLAVSHGSHHDDDAADLQAVWHGHWHAKSTPEHGHPGITEQTALSRAPAARLEAPVQLQIVDYVACPACAERHLARFFLARRTGAGPPPSSERQTILRV